MATFTLRFPREMINELSERYVYPGEEVMVSKIGPRVRLVGFFSRKDFLDSCRWKTPRSAPRCEQNSDIAIHDITQLALRTADEELRIRGLTILHGVGWPTASTILHFGHKENYPILDFRALWSLSWDVNPERDYNFAFWQEYVLFCRQIALESGVSMRKLDRALWQFSKENQPSTPSEDG